MEEANLLHARHLAQKHGIWNRIISTMQGLGQLYDHTGCRAEWRRLVEEIVPDFVDPATDGPLPGREEEWSLVTEYRVRLADEDRQWIEAERLQGVCVEWDRKQSAATLSKDTDQLDDTERNTIRTLAVSLHTLGQIQREQGKSECVTSYKKALDLSERIGEKPAMAICAFNLGHSYMYVPDLRDLVKAEKWYRRSLDLRDEGDRLGRGKCFNQLGSVAYECFKEAREKKKPEEELVKHLNDALGYYHKALDMILRTPWTLWR